MKEINLGGQGFEKIRTNHLFYIDKTFFIKEWWGYENEVTLITRPRRFGKTLNMDMMNCFFSNQYAGRSDLFEGLDIWNDEKYRMLQGTYPVIYISFANIKRTTADSAIKAICSLISEVYEQYDFLADSNKLSDSQKEKLKRYCFEINKDLAPDALNYLSGLLHKHYGKKVLIFLDEYDAPLQEAYLDGYWDEMVSFIQPFFSSTFKANTSMERGLMTGVTRVPKDSIFSGFNNLTVISTTTNRYETCFGFTEEEVFQALDDYNLSDTKEEVRRWYDGFTFGDHSDIYNPWSITNYLSFRKFSTYWANTSENALVGNLIRKGSDHIKEVMLDLMNGKEYVTELDEQIVFNQLDQNENAIWSLLLASGYLRVASVDSKPESGHDKYHLVLTDFEVKLMFENMFTGWFAGKGNSYNSFLKSLLAGDTEGMNAYISRLLLDTVSFFDGGSQPSEDSEPEKFYHGLVLGLSSSLRDMGYTLSSNRESGFGRYDIAVIPNEKNKDAIIIELKVKKPEEKNLQESVEEAKNQIIKKQYDADLIARGFQKEQIKHYGFAFEGKKVLIG